MIEFNNLKLNIHELEQPAEEKVILKSKDLEKELKEIGESDLKFLSRTELLEILLDYAKDNDRLNEDIKELQKKLDEKELKINKFGSIAQASLELNGVFEAAEASCTQYVENAKKICERQIRESAGKLEKAKKESKRIVETARAELKDIEGEKAKLMSTTILECEKMKRITAAECERKIREADEECQKRLSESEKQVSDNWEVLSKKLGEFYDSHQGLKELIDQGFLASSKRGKVNEA